MANSEHLTIFRQGVKVWNPWKEQNSHIHPNLSEQNFRDLDLRGEYAPPANLSYTDFTDCNLTNADFFNANLYCASFCNANLTNADFRGASLAGANLSGAILIGAKLGAVNLINADLSKAVLSGANLEYACLVDATVEETTFNNCRIHGISAWNLQGKPAIQSHLIITKEIDAEIFVDNLEVAQFIYLLLYNSKMREVIDTITSKVVLILGCFTQERKAVLDAIREELRKQNFTPIIFDFDKPASKDVTGTVETLARMAKFIIADLTDPRSIPHELATIIPFLRTTPVRLIKQAGATGYSMIEDHQRSYSWVISPYEYTDKDSLITQLPEVLRPANEMAERFRRQ